MKKIKLNIAIIGGGTAGMTALRSALKHTEKVAMVEGSHFGTTCARVGCMPSKLLIAAAEAAHHIKESKRFGIHLNEAPQINGREVMQRVQSERDRFVGFVLDTINQYDSDKIIRGFARFKDPNTLIVNEELEIQSKAIVIATGSTPVIPDIFKAYHEKILTNENIFELPDLPKSVAVVGTGIIALELGQALNRLGVHVVVLARSGRIGTLTDPVVQEQAAKIMAEELDIINKTEIINLSTMSDSITIEFKGENTELRREQFEKVLLAAGRIPNFKHLDLQNSGLKLDEKGVPFYNPFTTQCGQSQIFLAGDVSDHHPILHEAADEGYLAGDNAGRFPDIKSGKRRSALTVMFSDPQMAMVGQKYNELEKQQTVIGEVSFENQGRSRVMLINKGLLRVYAEKGSGVFLGAEMIGPRAEHIGHLLSWAHQQKLTIPSMLEMPFYHPVIEEGLRTALRDANRKL